MHTPAPPCPTESIFDFREFASTIYEEKRGIHHQAFLLPALYGGERCAGGRDTPFDSLIVLEGPSVSFTERLWAQCRTVDEAIDMHRAIFFDWARQGRQADVFSSLVPNCSTSKAFFNRAYVTDVWKNSTECAREGTRYERRYWLSKLQVEIERVRARRVVFIGAHARRHGFALVRAGLPKFALPFPGQGVSDFDLQVALIRMQVEELEERIRHSSG